MSFWSFHCRPTGTVFSIVFSCYAHLLTTNLAFTSWGNAVFPSPDTSSHCSSFRSDVLVWCLLPKHMVIWLTIPGENVPLPEIRNYWQALSFRIQMTLWRWSTCGPTDGDATSLSPLVGWSPGSTSCRYQKRKPIRFAKEYHKVMYKGVTTI